jgi:hypothetical protein
MRDGWRRWTCLGGGYPVQVQIGPADAGAEIARDCVSSAWRAYTLTRLAWVQAVAIAPAERYYPKGYSAWVRGADIGAGADRGEHRVQVLHVLGAGEAAAYQMATFSIRCGGGEYRVDGQVAYDADGRVTGTEPGNGEYIPIYPETAVSDIERAICQGRTPTGAAGAASVVEAVAMGVPKAAAGD